MNHGINLFHVLLFIPLTIISSNLILSFDGHMHIEDFLDWLQSVEMFFEYMDIPTDKQVKLVAYKLKGGALAWWEQINSHRHHDGKHPIRT